MRTSEVQEELDPNDVFGALALKSRRSPRPVLVNKSTRSRDALVGESARTRNVLDLVEKLGKTRSPVLLLGESGTGKEVVARAIHNVNQTGPFVVIDSASIVGSLMESELFGHVKGVIPGASAAKIGLIERANGGTVFLNDIDVLPLELQSKLVRALQDKEINPVGSSSSRRVDFRIIGATARNLVAEVEAGRFRRDLYFRLNVVNVRLAPLRERKEDLPALVNHFLSRLGGSYTITKQAMAVILLYDWPGNVGELETCIQHMVATSGRQLIDVTDFPSNIQAFLKEIEGTLLSKEKKPVESRRNTRLNPEIPGSLWAHALQTFGSAALAMEWFLAECGALDNQTPIDIVRGEGGMREVDRILGCIDYGMIA
jgi:DNA-binding NtrC family response regulator